MSKKELVARVGELERRVLALEGRPFPIPYYPQLPFGAPTITYGAGGTGSPLPQPWTPWSITNEPTW